MATAIITKSREYRDLDLNFNIHPIRKDINKHVSEMAVINSVKNLVLTNFYEKPFQPNFGSNVRGLLFENVDIVTASAIERAIEQVITNYEPRVNLVSVQVAPYFDENAFTVTMTFFIVNISQEITITFQLERTR